MKRFKIVNGKAIPTHAGPVTYWNLKPTPAKVVRVIVGKAQPGWWCEGLEGTEREAVMVDLGNTCMFLDNEAFDDHKAGAAWLKVTAGRGSPRYGHRSLPVARVVGGPVVEQLRSA